MYPLGTWFVSGMCVWIPCMKETDDNNNNRPDMTLVDETNKQAVSIDTAVPLAQNLQATNTEKHRKYQELAFEIKQQWQMNKTAGTRISLVLSGTRTITNLHNQSLMKINLQPHPLSQAQKIVTLHSCPIVRKFLNDKLHLLDEGADNP